MRFVDTSFWVSLQFRRDAHHDQAASIWRAGPGQLVTTNHVVGETWTFLRRRLDHRAAVAFHERITRWKELVVVHVDAELESDAWRWLRRHDERAYSFVDATSFATMRRRRLRDVLAFDDDFTAAGFQLVRA